MMYNESGTLARVMETTIKCADLVKKYFDSDEVESLNELDRVMLEVCEVDNILKLCEEADNETTRKANKHENKKMFDEILEAKLKKNVSPTKHDMYLKFKEKINATKGEDDPDLSMKDDGPNTKCPISMKTMTVPMKNKNCGHIYDQSSVLDLLKHSQRGIRCPVPGCASQRFKMSDLEVDEQLKIYISQGTS